VGDATQVGLLSVAKVCRDDAASRGGILMDEYVVELVEMFQKGEISAMELMDDLDMSGFDGDLIEYL
jgi:hypothetical protein